MANDFSGDADFVCNWKHDNGAIYADAIGGNTLSAMVGVPVADLVNFKEGDASIQTTNTDYAGITDANLDADFPIKSTGAGIWTELFWIYTPAAWQINNILLNKFALFQYTYQTKYDAGGVNSFVALISAGWPASESLTHGSAWANNQWYHVAVRFNMVTKAWGIRIWDDNASAILGGSTISGVAVSALALGTAILYETFVPGNGPYSVDEHVWCKRELTDNEIDQIRSGTFGGVPVVGGNALLIGSDF